MLEETGPDAPELSRVFHRCVREDEDLGIEAQVIRRWVGDQIAVTVAVADVQITTHAVLEQWA